MESTLREIQQRVSELLEMIEQEKQGMQYISLRGSVEPVENAIRRSIAQLMDATYVDKKGCARPVFSHAAHWQAVYRILVDYNLGATDGDYLGFAEWIATVEPAGCRVKFKYHSLRNISKTPFVRPFVKWKFDNNYFETRVPFDRMVCVAQTFLRFLRENGALSD